MAQFDYRVSLTLPPIALDLMGEVNRWIGRGLTVLASEMERRVKLIAPVGAGGEATGFKGSIAGEVRGMPIRTAVIGSTSPYGAVIEFGRRPGRMPPRMPIFYWLYRAKGKPATKETWRLAFVVARSISKRHIPGKYVFARAWAGALAENLPTRCFNR